MVCVTEVGRTSIINSISCASGDFMVKVSSFLSLVETFNASYLHLLLTYPMNDGFFLDLLCGSSDSGEARLPFRMIPTFSNSSNAFSTSLTDVFTSLRLIYSQRSSIEVVSCG